MHTIENSLVNTWEFLLEGSKETILLYPFWRYFEYLYQRTYSYIKITSFLDPQQIRENIFQNLNRELLEIVKRPLIWEFRVC